MEQENKESVPKEQSSQQPNSGRCHKVLTVLLMILMAAVGGTNIIIGVLNIDGCGNAMIIPVLLVVNGVLWMLPPFLVMLLNCFGHRYGDDLSCLHGCLEKLFFFSVAFLIASTIYTLVTFTQVKTLDFLCTWSWLPSYVLCVLVADWLCFLVFVRLFCTHPLPKEHSDTKFKHLKNLPPLAFPWNRHRALRTY